VRALIFDFGNVVGFFDYGHTLRRLSCHTDMTAGEMRDALSNSVLAEDYEAGRISSADFLTQTRGLWRLTCDDETLAKAWADIFQPNPEVCDLMPRLHGRYRLLLGSNTNELHTRQFRCQFTDTLRHFDALVLSHEIGIRKPQAGFFEHCRGLADCPPGECVFIDDLAVNIVGARACGLQTVHYEPGNDLAGKLGALGVHW